MPINFGALLTGATRGLSGYREGQRLGREDKRAEDAALFSEWAKRQELARLQAAQKAEAEYRNAMLGQRKMEFGKEEEWKAAERERQRQQDIADAIDKGYQAAPEGDMPLASAAVAGMLGAPNRFGAFGAPKAQGAQRYANPKAGVEAEAMGPVQYAQFGGRPMRKDPQQGANVDARKRAELYLQQRAMSDAAADRMRQRTQAVIDENGNYQVIDLDKLGDSGVKARPTAGASRFTAQQQTKIGAELGDLADIVAKAEETANTFADKGLGNATGWIRGRIGPGLEQMGMVPDKQVRSVANMENIGSAIRLARSGTAVSKYELMNLGFIPTKNMPEKGIELRAQELAANAEKLLMSKIEMYEAMGIDMSGVRNKLAAARGQPLSGNGFARPPLDSFADPPGGVP